MCNGVRGGGGSHLILRATLGAGLLRSLPHRRGDRQSVKLAWIENVCGEPLPPGAWPPSAAVRARTGPWPGGLPPALTSPAPAPARRRGLQDQVGSRVVGEREQQGGAGSRTRTLTGASTAPLPSAHPLPRTPAQHPRPGGAPGPERRDPLRHGGFSTSASAGAWLPLGQSRPSALSSRQAGGTQGRAVDKAGGGGPGCWASVTTCSFIRSVRSPWSRP